MNGSVQPYPVQAQMLWSGISVVHMLAGALPLTLKAWGIAERM